MYVYADSNYELTDCKSVVMEISAKITLDTKG